MTRVHALALAASLPAQTFASPIDVSSVGGFDRSSHVAVDAGSVVTGPAGVQTWDGPRPLARPDRVAADAAGATALYPDGEDALLSPEALLFWDVA